MKIKHGVAWIYQNFGQMVRYGIVGASATFLDLLILYCLVEFFYLPVLVAATLSFISAVTFSFLSNKYWTFKNTSRNFRKLYLKFFMVSLVGLLLTLSCMFLLINLLDLWYMLAKILTSMVVVIWNFLANKFWTFKLTEKNLDLPLTHDFAFSIIIPAYNEENRIKATLLNIDDYINSKKLNAEIIVVSDGSRDNTAQVVKKYYEKIKNLKLVHYSKNQGKGFAVKTGVENSKGKYILVTDADNSTPIEEFSKLYKRLKKENAQIAIGSRYLPSSNVKIKQPRYRILMGRIGNFLIRIFLLDGIKDTQCGFKLFTNRAAKEIFSLQKVKRFGFDMEALVIATNFSYKIVEVPVNWFNSAESRVRPIKDTFRTLIDLIYIKINLWSGRYSSE